MSAKFSVAAFVGLIVGGVAALPIYTQLPDNIRIAPNMYFLTIATCFIGWGVGAILHAATRLFVECWINRRHRR